MKVAYITRTNLASSSAQARQVNAMAKSFAAQLQPDDFLFVAAGDSDHNVLPPWIKLNPNSNGWLRYLFACLITVYVVLVKKYRIVYTRDIAIAFASVIVGGKGIYEAHLVLYSPVARVLIKCLALSNRFRLVGISQGIADYYSNNYKIPQKHILIAHDGVFPEEYAFLQSAEKKEVRKKLSLPADRQIISHTGSLYKGGAFLFEYLLQFAGNNTLIVQVGGTEKEQRFWLDYYQKRGYSNIRFVSHQPPDIVKQYQVCSDLVFYMTHRQARDFWCTSPLKLFEYMASGTPILAACIGSIREILNENNAFCFDPDNPESIHTALQTYLEHPLEAVKRSKHALELANNSYSWYIRTENILSYINRW